MNQEFLYCPKSGDRVFAERALGDVVIVTWRDRCRHVLGGVRLDLRGGGSRKHRDLLHNLGAAIVAGFGGVAWDEQGAISLIVPTGTAWEASEFGLRSLRKLGLREDAEAMEVQVVLAGVASLRLDVRDHGGYESRRVELVPGPARGAKVVGVRWAEAHRFTSSKDKEMVSAELIISLRATDGTETEERATLARSESRFESGTVQWGAESVPVPEQSTWTDESVVNY